MIVLGIVRDLWTVVNLTVNTSPPNMLVVPARLENVYQPLRQTEPETTVNGTVSIKMPVVGSQLQISIQELTAVSVVLVATIQKKLMLYVNLALGTKQIKINVECMTLVASLLIGIAALVDYVAVWIVPAVILEETPAPGTTKI